MATEIKIKRKKSILSGVASGVSNVVTKQILKEKKDGDYYLKQLSLWNGVERLNNEASIAATATANANKPAMPKQRSAEDMAEWDDSDGDWTREIAKAQGVDLKQPAVDPTEFQPPKDYMGNRVMATMAARTYEDRRVAKLVQESKAREQARLETVLPHQKSPRTRTMDVDSSGSVPHLYDARRRVLKEAAQRTGSEQDATEFAMSSIVPEQNPLATMHEAEYSVAEGQRVAKLVREAQARESARVRGTITAQQDATEYTLSDKVKRQNQLDAMHQADYGVASTQAARDAAIIEENVREEADEPASHWRTSEENLEVANQANIKDELIRLGLIPPQPDQSIEDHPPAKSLGKAVEGDDTRVAEALANALRALKDKKFRQRMLESTPKKYVEKLKNPNPGGEVRRSGGKWY